MAPRFNILPALVVLCLGSTILLGDEHPLVSGQVTDSSGAVIPGASIRCLSKDKGFEFRTVTGSRGEFSFGSLGPGAYELTVEAPGFAAARMDNIRVDSFQTLMIPIVLQVGTPSTTISISARPSAVDTTDAAVRDVLPSAALKEMPILTGTQGRSVLAQAQLLFPGASSYRFTGLGDDWGMSLSINGSGYGGVGFSFDGIDNNYLLGTGSATVGPNPDALEELSVLSQNYSAESGGHQAEVHWRTRSGSNGLHGQARALQLNPALSARDFFEAEKAAQFRTTAFGFQASGPVVVPAFYDGHNRTFWFFDTEWTRSNLQQVARNSFPNDAERSGDFSGLPAKLRPIDPLTKAPFPDGRLPATRIVPQSRFYIDEFVPRAPADGQVTSISAARPAGYQFTTRLDHRLNAGNQLSGSLFFQRSHYEWNDASTIGVRPRDLENDHNLSVQYVKTLSARVTNSFTFGSTRYAFNEVHNGKYQDVDLLHEGYNIYNVTSGPRGFPFVALDSNRFDPDGYHLADELSTWHWKDDLAIQRRRHAWKFGGDLRRSSTFNLDTSWVPSFSFSRYNPSGTGNDLADLLLGLPVSYGQGSDGEMESRRLLAALYAQDDIRVRADLTLNFGLRYDLRGALHNRDGRNGIFRPGSKSKVFPNAPAGIVFNGDFDPALRRLIGDDAVPPDHANVAPRLGIAWSPGFRNSLPARLFGAPGRSSIRAGYGLYYILGQSGPIWDAEYLPPWFVKVQRDRSSLDRSGGNMADPWGADPDPFAGTLTQRDFFPPLQGVPYFESSLRNPVQHQWSLSVQRQLPREIVLDVTYLGNLTLHLMRGFAANPGVVGPGANPYNLESRRTYKDFGNVKGYASDGTSVYHGMQLRISRRFSSSLLFSAHYVWSRTLDDASGIGLFTLADRAVTPWGRADTDRTHSLAGYWVAELPGPSKSPALRHALSGWRLSGNVQLRTGMPLQIRNPVDSTLQGFAAGMPDITGPFRTFDPREIHTFTLPGGRTVTGNFLFDPTVFKTVIPATPEAARAGNLGRNVFSGPGMADVDLSLLREIRLTERHRVEVRVDSINALNHAQFVAMPATMSNTNNIQFGRVLRTTGPRRVQFQIRYSY